MAYLNRTKVLLTGWLANETAEGSIWLTSTAGRALDDVY